MATCLISASKLVALQIILSLIAVCVQARFVEEGDVIDEYDDGGFFFAMITGIVVAMLTGCFFCYCMPPPPGRERRVYQD